MTETLLLVVIALLTVNILFVGVYIVLVLKEVRQSITKINQILDSFAAISSAVATPIAGASGAVTAITEGAKALRKIREVAKHKKEN